MTTHPTTPRKQNSTSLPNQPFFSWVRTQTTLFIGQIIGLLSVVSVPIALFYYSMHSLPKDFEWQKLEKVGHYVIYAHLVFLVLFIAFLISKLDKNDVGRYRARLVHKKLNGGKRASDKEFERLEAYSTRQVGRFKFRFLLFWCSMFGLYLVFAVEPLLPVFVGDSLNEFTGRQMFRAELFPLLSFALNNLSLIFVFWCFTVLYIPPDSTTGNFPPPVSTHTKGDATPSRDVKLWKQMWLRFYGYVCSLVRYLTAQDLQGPERRQRILIVWFVVVIAMLTLSFPAIMLSKIGKPTNWSEYPAVFDALSGTINAIALALLVAKLDSKLIGLPSWLICILYFYAGVQPMFVVFELHPEVYAGIKTAVLWVVFVFKIYFFLIIFYALQTGRVFNYFFCSQVLNKHVETLKAAQRDARLLWATKSAPKAPPAATAAKKIEQSQPVNPEERDPRATWFKVLGVVAILFFVGSLLVYVSLSKDQKSWADSSLLSDGVILLHIVLLAIILFVVFWLAIRDWWRAKKSGSTSSDDPRFEAPSKLMLELKALSGKRRINDLSTRTKKQFKSFTRYFRLFWILLLVLYVTMWFSTIVPDIPPQHIPAVVASTTEGKGDVSEQSVVPAKGDQPIWSLDKDKAASSEHNQPAPRGDHESETTPSQKSAPAAWSQVVEQRLSIDELPGEVIFPFAFFVINNLMVLVLFWCFAVLYIPNADEKFDEKHRRLFLYSLLIWVLITLLVPLFAIIIKGNGLTPSEIDKIPTILGAVGGTLNAVAFALLIARLDSRIIGLRLLLVTVLYAYAALQPLFVTFNQPSKLLKFIATSAMISAFIFKICLVLMVGHVRNSGGLINYLWFFPFLSNSVNAVFSNQFEIKTYSPTPGRFTFSIFNENVETYRAVKIHDTRAECDGDIKTLVNAMKTRENYSKKPEELQGTFWVQVKSDSVVVCESKGLRSPTEVDDLINESMERVPYCKYDRG